MTDKSEFSEGELIAGLFFTLHCLCALLESKGALAPKELANALEKAASMSDGDGAMRPRERAIAFHMSYLVRNNLLPKIPNSRL